MFQVDKGMILQADKVAFIERHRGLKDLNLELKHLDWLWEAAAGKNSFIMIDFICCSKFGIIFTGSEQGFILILYVHYVQISLKA